MSTYIPTKHYRSVLELYKYFSSGNKPKDNEFAKVRQNLNFAIDYAMIHDLPYDELDALKKDVDYLNYEL